MAVDEATARVLGHDDRRVANALITWRYHELALALSERLGGLASWFAFGTWASRSAGRVIRGEQFGGEPLGHESFGAEQFPGEHLTGGTWTPAALPAAALDRRVALLSRSDRGAAAGHARAGTVLERYVDGVRRRMADLVWAGNRMVFVDLAPPFTALCETFTPGRRPSPGQIEAFLGVHCSTVPASGRDRSLALLCRALASDDGRERAQLVAVSALEAVRYEQVRLDPYVDSALQAPSAELRHLLRRAVADGLPDWLRPLALLLGVGLVRPFLSTTAPVVDEMTTRHLVSWSLGDQLEVRVNADLTPPAPGLPFLPSPLEPPHIAEMVLFLAQGGTSLDGSGTAVRRWGDLEQRMRFITNLFCSRFAVPELLQPPFTSGQVDQLRRGVLPADLP
jgi:hypothetical protein